MHWFGGLSYITAATIAVFNGHHPMFAFVAIVLLAWLGIAVSLETRTSSPSTEPVPNGWTGSLSIAAVSSLATMRQLALIASVMRLGLVFFSSLLVVWALLL